MSNEANVMDVPRPDVQAAGPAWAVVLLAIANALLGMALGLFFSAFATSEFQAVQFMPAVLFPQILLAGLLIPRTRMPDALEVVSDALPITYAYDALGKVTADDIDTRLWLDIAIVAGSITIAPCSAPQPSGAAPKRRRQLPSGRHGRGARPGARVSGHRARRVRLPTRPDRAVLRGPSARGARPR
jgi:hypothetical protein